jgi:hypothetical protein
MSKLLDLADDLSACVGASATESKIIMRVENALRAEVAKSAENMLTLRGEVIAKIGGGDFALQVLLEDGDKVYTARAYETLQAEVEALRAENAELQAKLEVARELHNIANKAGQEAMRKRAAEECIEESQRYPYDENFRAMHADCAEAIRNLPIEEPK